MDAKDVSDNAVKTNSPPSPPAANSDSAMKGGRRNTRKNRRNNMRRNNTRRNNIAMEGGAKLTVGTKAQVYHGTAKHTSGGLKKKDLMKHKGKIVSRRKHAAGLKAIKRLRKLGYTAKKGTFKLFKKSK